MSDNANDNLNNNYGLTATGWNNKRLRDILDESEETLSQIQDPKTGNTLNPNFQSDDPAMQIVQVPLNQTSLVWNAAQLAFNQYNPNTATGPSLDAIGAITGIQRLSATPAVIAITLTGTLGATIPAGQRIGDAFDTQFFTTDETIQFTDSTSIKSTATCDTTGPQTIKYGTITKIITPVSGWDTVSNTDQLTQGSTEENDADFENRRQLSNAAPSAAPADSVYANLANLEGVQYVRVYINNTLKQDAHNIPPKCQAVVIQGGDEKDIAKTILARSGATAQFYGSTAVTLYDEQGEPNTIAFSRPKPVIMNVEINITVTDPTQFPSNGITLIKNNIITYAAQGADALGTTQGFNDAGFPPGESVTVSRLYTPINAVPGHRINTLTVNDNTTEVPVAFDEIAYFNTNHITVTLAS